MPATPSSLVARIAQRLGHRDQPTPPEQGLVAHLATVPDPRDRRGVRHRLTSLLSVAVCAVLAGARSLSAIGEWAADAPAEVLVRLGVRTDPLTVAESFFAVLKTEIATRVWPPALRPRKAVFAFITYYNQDRLHSTLKYRTPYKVRVCYGQDHALAA